MPVTKYLHPITREEVPFDHFDTDTSCNGRPAFPPWMARFVAMRIGEDLRHGHSLALTATGCLGCPRQKFIEVQFEYAVDPSRRFVMDRGSALHKIMAESWNTQRFVSEDGPGRGLLTVEGKLFGTKVSAQLDCVAKSDRITEIIDGKFPMDWSVRYRGKKFDDEREQYVQAVGTCRNSWPRIDYAVQVNIGRLLLAQQAWAQDAGYDPETVKLTIWDHACGYEAGPVAQDVPHFTEEQMLRVRPGGGRYTLEQIVGIQVAMQEEWERRGHEAQLKPETKEEVASMIPLVGAAGMFGGKKCSQYCDVEEICSRIVRERGAPE